LRLIHTSDLHVGATYRSGGPPPDAALASLVAVTERVGADAVLIAGDFFDHGRVAEAVVSRAAALLDRTAAPVVVLPGNHDPYIAESPWVKFAHHFGPRMHVLAGADGERISFEDLGLQIWGRAHTNFEDVAPVALPARWIEDGGRTWRVALAHGHYVESDYESRFSYRIHREELTALDAHYVALGHLEMHARVGGERVNAYYSSAPIRSGAFTQVDLTPEGVEVCEVRGAAH
jgi:DNA repair exonuclease SbcCD nuclease subunit